MFTGWGFLLGEIWVLILLAGLVGLLAGYLIWGRQEPEPTGNIETDRLQGELDKCTAQNAGLTLQVTQLQQELEGAQAALADYALSQPTPVASDPGDYDKDGVVEGTDEGVKPRMLSEPEGGAGDDLKLIKGIGPKLEQLCHSLGVWHYHQIAHWTADEVAWMDANLEGFKGRVSRDNWVDQAKTLAGGGQTEFSLRQ
jgi:predicted flap endonuclease-1-like 5' DNA nuclease